MKLGAERKKLLVLVGLVALAAVVWVYQFQSSPTTPAAAPPARTIASPSKELRATADEILENRGVAKGRAGNRNLDFKPSLKKTKPGELDADKVDPTLRIDLLEKVQGVEYQGAERNLFQFGAAKPKLTPQQVEAAKKEAAQAAEKLAETKNTPPPEPAKPKAPPINLKYYGYANRPGDPHRRAFLMDGDDIVVAAEGEVLKKRYKVVRIGLSSIVLEDLDFHSQQTLQLQETG